MKAIYKNIASLAMLLIVSYSMVFAQQVPNYSSYYLNPYLLNPGYAGHVDKTTAFLLYRNQWVGITGSPETQYISVNSQFGKRAMGLAGNVYNDVSNIYGRSGGYLSYSYRVMLDSTHSIRVGASLGLTQNRLYFDRIQAQDPTESTILISDQNNTNFDGAFGALYTMADKLEIGLSAMQIFNSKFIYADQANERTLSYQLIRHFYLSGTYHFELKPETWHLHPIMLLRSAQGAPIQVDGGLQAEWKQFLGLTVLYRSNFGLATSLQAQVNPNIKIGYTYEVPLNGMQEFSIGSHEVVLVCKFSALKKGSKDHDSEHDHGKLEGELDTLQNKLNRLEDYNITHEKEAEQLALHEQLDDERIRELTSRVDSLKLKVNELEDVTEDHQKQMDSLQAQKKVMLTQMDSLHAKKDKLIDEVRKNSEAFEELRKEHNAKKDKFHKFIMHENVNLAKEDSFDIKRWDYFVVIDAYTNFNYAKFIQKVFKRDYNLETKLFKVSESESGEEYYLVKTKQVYSKEEAQAEIERINTGIDDRYTEEGAWIYHIRKKFD